LRGLTKDFPARLYSGLLPEYDRGSMRKISISLTDELDDALESMAIAQGVNKSRVIDNYLRENKVVQHYLDILRSEPDTGVYAVSRKVIGKMREKAKVTA
jgi:metal-responsive CopG/Arc/MetJ family transcriptional regulator